MDKQPVSGAVRIHTTFIMLVMLYGHTSWYPKIFTILIQRSLITDHHTNIIIMEKFEILCKLPKYDSEA